METGKSKGTIVRYSFKSQKYKNMGNNHFVWEQGAWRGKIRTLAKKY
jgi:hypothetical protein